MSILQQTNKDRRMTKQEIQVAFLNEEIKVRLKSWGDSLFDYVSHGSLYDQNDDELGDIDFLIELLQSDDPLTRTCAAHALGQMGPTAKPAVAALDRCPEDTDPEVRETVAEALQQIGR